MTLSVDRGVRIWFMNVRNTRYFLAIENLTFICLSNNNTKLNQKIDAFIESCNTPEAKTVGTLMKGLRLKLVHRLDNLYDLNSEIKSYIYNMKDIENKKLINGKWLLLLSCFKHHERKFKEARALLDQI